MQFNTYTVAGAHIAAWLVNNPASEPSALAAVLDSYDVHQPVTTTAQMRALRPWIQRLRGLFEAGTVAGKAERADALLNAANCRPRLISHGAGLPFHLHYAPVRTGLEGSRLGACSRAGCGTAFVDTSRNGRRHFCSVRCANQVNVANHRLRQRQPR